MSMRAKTRMGLAGFSALAVMMAMFVPALAHKGPKGEPPGHAKGKAVIESFDPATRMLTVKSKKGEVVTVEVTEDARIYVIQHGHGDGKPGNSEGSFDDLVPGARIVMMKVRDGLVTKIKLSAPKQHCDDSEEPTEPGHTTTADVPPCEPEATPAPEPAPVEPDGSGSEEGDTPETDATPPPPSNS